MKNYTAQLSKDDAQKLVDLYGSVYSGIQKSVAGFIPLQQATMAEIKGIFTREEIIAMADSLNGTIHEDRFMANKKMVLYGFEDSENIDGTFTRHGASFHYFTKKFNTLSSAQCYFLIEEIRRFWEDKSAYGSPSPDIEMLFKKLGQD